MSGAEHHGWHELYKNALMETDPEKLKTRIAEACRAIRARVAELRSHRSPQMKEQSQLDNALYFLNLLHGISQRNASLTRTRKSAMVAHIEVA